MTASWKDIKWLDVAKLSQSLLKPHQELVGVKYFTSYITNPNKFKRQKTYLEALETVGVQITLGKYQMGSYRCSKCKQISQSPTEKMTDVNIATFILEDAMNDRFDKAILISGDSDLVPPINAIRRNFPEKSVIVAFPPNRANEDMKAVAHGSFTIGRAKLRGALLPERITKQDGYILKKPVEWK